MEFKGYKVSNSGHILEYDRPNKDCIKLGIDGSPVNMVSIRRYDIEICYWQYTDAKGLHFGSSIWEYKTGSYEVISSNKYVGLLRMPRRYMKVISGLIIIFNKVYRGLDFIPNETKDLNNLFDNYIDCGAWWLQREDN